MKERYPDQNQINHLRQLMQIQFTQNAAPEWAYQFAGEILTLPEFAVEYFGGPAGFIRIYHTEAARQTMMGIHTTIVARLKMALGEVSWLDVNAATFAKSSFLAIEHGKEVWYPTWEARVHAITPTPMGQAIAMAWLSGIRDYRAMLSQMTQQQ